MLRITVVAILATIVEAYVEEHPATGTHDVRHTGMFIDNFVDKLLDRTLPAPIWLKDLEKTTLRKPGHLKLPGGTMYKSTIPSLPRHIPIHSIQGNCRNNQLLRSSTTQVDPEVVRDPRQQFTLKAPSIFKPYFGAGYRETFAYSIIPNTMWGFEQSQELGSLSVNIRCTVIRLKSGGLWVHAPLFPTDEFLTQLGELDGEVEYIILPTYALEHKIPMGPFIERMRERAEQTKSKMPEVWAVPDTWSFPLDLPPSWLGIPVDGVIGQGKCAWSDEIEFKILRIADVGKPFVEAVFFHRDSKTLIVTDTVYQVPQDPPDVVRPSLLLDVAPDDPTKPLPDTTQTRQQAWAKMALLVAFFIPAHQRLVEGGKAEWQEGYMDSFRMISDRLLVSPILQKLVFEKSAPVVRDWIEDVAKWPFVQVVPAHYAAPVQATPQDLLQAYGFAFKDDTDMLPKEDMKTLNDLGEVIKLSTSGRSDEVYSRLFDKFFKNLFVEKPGWLKQ